MARKEDSHYGDPTFKKKVFFNNIVPQALSNQLLLPVIAHMLLQIFNQFIRP